MNESDTGNGCVMSQRASAMSVLPDYLVHGLSIVFVGINPGLRSAKVGHHYAGPSNRFWKLLFDSGLLPDPLTYRDDWRLPDYGYGLTNVVSRPTSGIHELRQEDYHEGKQRLREKFREYQPRMIALLGVGIARAVLPTEEVRVSIKPGIQQVSFQGIPVFVLPNPSGRNAHYSYEHMKELFVDLKAYSSSLISLNKKVT